MRPDTVTGNRSVRQPDLSAAAEFHDFAARTPLAATAVSQQSTIQRSTRVPATAASAAM
jgi:hypothetical protein